MAKNPFEDVSPSGRSRRALSDVLPGERRRPRENREVSNEEDYEEPLFSRMSTKLILLAFAVLIIIGGVSYSLWVGATVTLTRKSVSSTLDASVVAEERAPAGGLGYVTLSISRVSEKEVPATGEKNVEKRAAGTIVIYNNYSAASQRLVTNTRFETPEGKIYRISAPVVIPGRKGTGSNTTPGSIEAVVTADSPGEEYNGPPTDMTIPGFKGTPQYSKFYARSKTSFVGGFRGVVKTAKPEDLAAARAEIDISLRSDLMSEARAELPPGYILFEKAVGIKYEDQSPPESNLVKRKASLLAVIFDHASLALYLATRSGVNSENAPVHIASIESSVTPQFLSPISEETLSKKKLSVHFTGTPTFWFTLDETKLIEDIAGKPKDALSEIFASYVAIKDKEVRVSVHPFWLSRIPEDTSAITVRDESGEGSE
ncbi:MAG: hypothetical protein AAB597_02950 [Patescibacteria group bacterium]